MADEKYTLNVYQGDEQVGTGDSAKVHVDLEAKEYPAGTFTGELVNAEGTKSKRFDFPAVTVAPKTVAVTGVTMSQATATGDIGKTVVLTATVAPETATDKTVVWTSSDDKIATVKDGTVTFVAAGTADITATVGGKSATTKVTVKTPVIAVTKITLDPATASVEAGKTVALTAKVEPDNATDKTVAWTSSDDKIATVKDGTVTGVAAGEATITGTSADGKITGTVTVTVTAPAAG